MFSKQIEEIKDKEDDMECSLYFHEEKVKEVKAKLATLTKARKQLEKLQEQVEVEGVAVGVADEQPDISDERTA